MDSTNADEPWDWEMDDDFLGNDLQLDISTSLWGEVNQNEDDVLCILDKTTPAKDCSDVDVYLNDTGENTSKEFQKSREPLQFKRRRMLQFDSSEQMSSAFLKSKVREEELMEDPLPIEDLEWASRFPSRCTAGGAELDQSSEGWLSNCFNDNEMQISLGGMTLSGISKDQSEIPEYCNVQPERRSRTTQEAPVSSSRCIFRGRKSFGQSSTKLTTCVAYPFALIKPCGEQGDMTLKDINRRIKAPPPILKNEKNKDRAFPTSAFSGKPVVGKTKIRTEGGSITITRTKG